MAGIIHVGADWHIGHHKAAEWRGFSSTKEHDQSVIKSALSTVGKRDSVIILGDVCFRPASYFDELLEHYLPEYFPGWVKGNALPFDLKVVGGNHDRPNLQSSKYIKYIQGCIDLKFRGERYILTHIPIHPASIERWKMNIHGHMHQHSIDDPRYKCVSYEQCGALVPMFLVAGQEWD